MLLWPCGRPSEMPRGFLQLYSLWPPFLPNLPLSTTPWSTCCVSPTSVSVSTETHLRSDRRSTGVVHTQIRENIWDPPRSVTRTWVCPHASQMGSRSSMGHVYTALTWQTIVIWPHPKGLSACWMDLLTERGQYANSHPNHRLISSSGTIGTNSYKNVGQVLKKTERWLGMANRTSKSLHRFVHKPSEYDNIACLQGPAMVSPLKVFTQKLTPHCEMTEIKKKNQHCIYVICKYFPKKKKIFWCFGQLVSCFVSMYSYWSLMEQVMRLKDPCWLPS